jgi:hypothetical protein
MFKHELFFEQMCVASFVKFDITVLILRFSYHDWVCDNLYSVQHIHGLQLTGC